MSDENKNETRASSSDSELVEVPFEGNAEEKAILLLAAAEENGDDASVVRTSSGAFIVPKSLADKAGVQGGKDLSKKADDLRAKVTRSEDEVPETIKGGAGPTGTVDTNAGEDAEQGSVQDQADENAAPRSNIETINERQSQDDGEQKQRRTTKKAASKKSESSKNDSQE
jgi:hypothetical protein